MEGLKNGNGNMGIGALRTLPPPLISVLSSPKIQFLPFYIYKLLINLVEFQEAYATWYQLHYRLQII